MWQGIRNVYMKTDHTPAEDLQKKYRAKNKVVQKNARQDKIYYFKSKTEGAEEAARPNDSRKIYNIIRTLAGKPNKTLQRLKTMIMSF